jgi:hypothetical protein
MTSNAFEKSGSASTGGLTNAALTAANAALQAVSQTQGALPFKLVTV